MIEASRGLSPVLAPKNPGCCTIAKAFRERKQKAAKNAGKMRIFYNWTRKHRKNRGFPHAGKHPFAPWPSLDACQVPSPVRGVVAERGVGADDYAKRIRYNREVASAKYNVDFIFTQAGVYTIADAAEAQDGSMLQGSRQGHARRAS